MNLSSMTNMVLGLLVRDEDAAAGLLAAMAGVWLMVMLFGLITVAFMIFCFWRIFTRTGHGGPMAFLTLVPGFGFLIVVLILAFTEWPAMRGQPVPDQR